jgi:hypothetical protein
MAATRREVVTGFDYGNLLLWTRLNGEVVQKEVTSDPPLVLRNKVVAG